MKQRLGGIFALAMMTGVSGTALAQSEATTTDEQSVRSDAKKIAGDEEADPTGTIVVTGSRIRRDTFNSASPMQVVTRGDSSKAGFNSTSDVLQDVAITGGARQIDNSFGGYVIDGGPGVNTLGLRGLGATRTLVLLNGRRVGPSGTRGSVGAADLNVLPNAIVDRIEILKDGASSIYGSDAVAGVVNIVTRTNASGLWLEGSTSVPESGAGVKRTLSAVGGYTSDRFNIVGSLEVHWRSNLTLGDARFARCQTEYVRNAINAPFGSGDYRDPRTGLPKCYPIGDEGMDGVTINTIGTSFHEGAGGPGNPEMGSFNRWRNNPAVTRGVIGWEGVNGGGITGFGNRDTFDERMLDVSLVSPTTNYTGYFQASYDLQALGGAEIYTNALYARRESHQTGFSQLSLDYPEGSPLVPAALRFSSLPATEITGQNPLGVRVFTGNFDRSSQRVDFYRLGGGIRGSLPFPGWNYDLFAGYSNTKGQYTEQVFLKDRLQHSVDVVRGASDGFICRNASDGCIAAPAITADFVRGDWPSGWVKYVRRDLTGTTRFSELTFAASFDGPIFKLPYGEVGLALGAEYRKQKIHDAPDINFQNGNVFNESSSGVTRGSDHVKELYVEAEIPVLANLPGAKELTINASARYTDYASYGSDWTYKIGGIWTPVSALSLRTSYGTSYRAPALFEQFLAPTTGFLPSSLDPCDNLKDRNPQSNVYKNCIVAGLPADFRSLMSVTAVSKGGAETGLIAETSKNFAAGLILQPKLPEAVGNFEFAVDYYAIRIDNGVSSLSADGILKQCYRDEKFDKGNNGGEFCKLILRDMNNNGALEVDTSYINISVNKVRGIDYTLRYNRKIGEGNLVVNTSISQYLEQASRVFPSDTIDEDNGEIFNPRFAGSLNASYQLRHWTLRYGLTWIGNMDSYAALEENPKTSAFQYRTPDYFKHDLSLTWEKDGFGLTMGVRNLIDKQPPSVSAYAIDRLGNAPLYSGFDFIGRSYFVNFRAKI